MLNESDSPAAPAGGGTVPEQQGSLLLIDKPYGWTSFDVVAKVRNALKKSGQRMKVGHCGTLDPKATGLLLLATGRKTKTISSLEILDKVYEGTIKLGVQTASHDTETPEFAHCSTDHLTHADMIRTAASFIGQSQQLPPMHSAVWHNGTRLYEHARKGEVVRDRKPRNITIFRFEITGTELPFVHVRLHVSKGAYIRVIADEFGRRLGVGGYLAALRRTAIGEWELGSAKSLEETIGLILHDNNSCDQQQGG